jgi:hypothetical protein
MTVRLIFASPDGAPAVPSVAETASGSMRWNRVADEDASVFIGRVIRECPTGDELMIAWPKA